MPSAVAEDPALTREQIITQYKEVYVPQFEKLLVRMNTIKSTALKVPTLKKSFEYVYNDYMEETGIINTTVADPKGDVTAILGYSQEEVDEIGKLVTYLESQVRKVTTIKCVKGKTVKTVTDVSAKCPKGFTIKK